MRSPLPALARWVSSRPWQALGAVALLTLVMGVSARDVRLDNNFAGLFSTSSADARFREQYRTTFGADDGLLIAVIEMEEPTEAGYAAVAAMTTAASRMPEVDHVDSVTTLDVVRHVTTGDTVTTAVGPAFGDATAALPLAERVKLAATSELGAANVISRDGRTALVVANLAAKYDSYEKVTGPADDFRSRIDAVLAKHPGGLTVHYAGVAFTRIAAISEMQGDLLKLFPLATLMMGALLWWFFRRPIAVIAPMVAITVSTVCTAGVIGLAGDDINQITIIFPVLLMGVVVATATHLLHRYYRERALGATAADAARITLERISRAAVVCTVTNAIGFVSLATAKMQILHEFGFYLACGVVFCFVATSLAIPALLVLRDSRPIERYEREWGAAVTPESRWQTWTARYAWTATGPGTARAVQLVGVLLAGGAVLIATTARYDYSLSGMLNADRPTSVGNAVIDSKLSGIVPIEVSVLGEPGAFADIDNVDRLTALSTWLWTHEHIRAVGLPAVLDAAAGPGQPEMDATTGLRPLYDVIRAQGWSNELRRLVTDDYGHTRLRAFHRDTGSTAIVAMAKRIDAKGAELFAGTGIAVQVTGEAPVAYAGMNDLTRELVMSTIIAIGLIVLAIGIAFRSITLAIVALLPNVAPVAVGFALYTLARDVLDPVPGVVFCVAMGLAADDTVHLLNRFRELRPGYRTSREALADALVSVRRAMVSSSVVLVASFLALGVSGFPTNRTLGLLGALVLLLALGSDLLFGTTGLAIAGAAADREGRSL